MILTVPRDESFYPTLGPQVCDFIEQNMCFGPGDLLGQPVVLDQEKLALIYRMYEVFPRGHALEGRRRFQRCAVSLPKGSGKTELAAWVAACELHADAPVRCDGWTKGGEPMGRPVTDPYIPMVAYTEEQSSELAYGALVEILKHSQLRHDFDIGLDRILRSKGNGKAVTLSSSPSARDGARTTFCVCDETHLWVLNRLVHAHQVLMNNLPKRKIAQSWMFEVTTAPEPGAGSVAEATMDFAIAVDEGRIAEASFFFFHRAASPEHDVSTEEGARAAIIESSGEAASWRDIDGIMNRWKDPTVNRTLWERVWCNRLVKSGSQAFDVPRWKALAKADYKAKPGALITVGFDGAQFHDGTGLECCEVDTGFLWTEGLWECPPGGEKRTPPWQVPTDEVDAKVRWLFEYYDVWRMYADPPYWQSWIALWTSLFGKEQVLEWWTNRRKPMSNALENFNTAITDGAISHDGDKRLTRHLGNSRKVEQAQKDENGRALWLIQKDRPDSPNKIDLAMAAVLAWEARTDAIAAGVLKKKNYRVFFMGGVPNGGGR